MLLWFPVQFQLGSFHGSLSLSLTLCLFAFFLGGFRRKGGKDALNFCLQTKILLASSPMFGKKKAKDAPPPGEPPAADSSGAGLDLSNLLTAFYEKHAPHKVKNVSNLLTHIEGGDLTVEELNQLLVDEYGEGFVPSVSEESSPNKDPPETELVAGPEEQQSGTPPTDDSSSALKQLLTSFYLAHAPSKLDEPDKVDRVIEGFSDNIDDLNAALKREYGQDLDDFAAQGFVPQDEGPPPKPESQPPSASPEPAPTHKAAPAPTPTAATAAGDTDSQFKARLYVFYGQHAPDKVGNVETLAVQVVKTLLCQPCTPPFLFTVAIIVATTTTTTTTTTAITITTTTYFATPSS